MHPALSLAKRKLDDLGTEFRNVLEIEAEVIPRIAAVTSQAGTIAKNSLRATGIEGVYTGIEGLLKEILTAVDGGIFAGADSWHAHLLAQAAEPNQEKRRAAIISGQTYHGLDRLRSFRHLERNIYRHLLRERDVEDNLERLKAVFPSFEAEVSSFFTAFPHYSEDDG